MKKYKNGKSYSKICIDASLYVFGHVTQLLALIDKYIGVLSIWNVVYFPFHFVARHLENQPIWIIEGLSLIKLDIVNFTARKVFLMCNANFTLKRSQKVVITAFVLLISELGWE